MSSFLSPLGPVHIYPFLFENRDTCFSGLAYCPHIFGENGHRKCILSKMLSCRVKIFENAGYSFMCGQKEMEVLKCCKSFTTSKTHAVRDNIVFPLFCLFVWTGKIDLNLLHVDTCFWKSPFSKISGYVRTGLSHDQMFIIHVSY